MAKGSMKKNIITAGGTGGHVFPALCLAQEWDECGQPYIFVTDQRGIKYIPKEGLKGQIVVLPLGSKQSGLKGFYLFLYQLIHSFFRSIPVVFRSKSVIGFSGFPTFPTLMAGLLCLKPLFVHEQNAVLGKVNRLLGPVLKKIFTSTPSLVKMTYLKVFQSVVSKKIQYVGMPVRQEIQALWDEPYQMPDLVSPFNLLVIGGSQGASILGETVAESLLALPLDLQKRINVHHQVRPVDQKSVEKIYQKTQVASYKIESFIVDMAQELKNAHLVIARSGASTMAELSVAGRPCVYVPFKAAADDHQNKNADESVMRGGAFKIQEKDLDSEALARLLLDLFSHPKKLLYASERVRSGCLKSSIKILSEEVLNV